jgi:hypothetical protein
MALDGSGIGRERSYGMGSFRFTAMDRNRKSDPTDQPANSAICLGRTLQQGRRSNSERDQLTHPWPAGSDPWPRRLRAAKRQMKIGLRPSIDLASSSTNQRSVSAGS